MKRHEFTVFFDKEYHDVVKSIVDKYRDSGNFISYRGQPIFDGDGNYTSYRMWFRVKRRDYKMCKEVFHTLEEVGIVKIEKES